jgi:hypothetical protein
MTDKLRLPQEWIDEQLRGARWQTASSGGSTCVEVAFLDEGIVALRDSKNPHVSPLLFTDAEYEAFRQGVIRGELRRS